MIKNTINFSNAFKMVEVDTKLYTKKHHIQKYKKQLSKTAKLL